MTGVGERVRLFKIARAVLARGGNMIEHLTGKEGVDRRLAIEIAYALQSGSYTRYAATPTAIATRRESHAILEPLLREHDCHTLLDCGAGEGTRWLDFAGELRLLTLLDASWSRLAQAPRHLETLPGVSQYRLIKGDMKALPFAQASFDAVFTSHAVEPNTDEDAAAIVASLFRQAGRLVVMFEPNYRAAHTAMRTRMERHGYARNIWDVAFAQPGWTNVCEGRMEVSPNEDNHTSYMAFRRDDPVTVPHPRYRDPASGLLLHAHAGALADEAGCMAYPMVGGIACLGAEDAIFIGDANVAVNGSVEV